MFDFLKKPKPVAPPLQRPRVKTLCPFCLTLTYTETALSKCPKCNEELPNLYQRAIYGEPQRWPLFLQVAGYSQSGKTVWLQALTLMIRKMQRVWPGFYFQAATPETNVFVKDIDKFIRDGGLPEPSQLINNNVYLMVLSQMGPWPGCSLVIRDCSGEAFDDMKFAVKHLPYFLYAPTTLLFYSMNDDLDVHGRTMDGWLTNYINTCLVNNVKLQTDRRNLVVNLSKGDAIRNLPNHLRDYMINDSLWADLTTPGAPQQWTAERMNAYMRILDNVSDSIAEWLVYRGDSGASGLIAMARENNIQLRFTLTSSLGAAPIPGIESINTFSPRRVLDPFFWALQFGRQ